MSSLAAFDPKGVLGPATTLIYNSQYFSNHGIVELADLLKENFMKLANFKPKGKKEFCDLVWSHNKESTALTPEKIVSTRFFQSMQKADPSPNHQKVLDFIIPQMMKTVQDQIPAATKKEQPVQEVNEWMARCLESYMPDSQIEQFCKLQDVVSSQVLEERKKLGMQIYQMAETGKITEADLDVILAISDNALEQLKNADHGSSTLSLAGKYLILYSMSSDNSTALGRDVIEKLHITFRQKFFPKQTIE